MGAIVLPYRPSVLVICSLHARGSEMLRMWAAKGTPTIVAALNCRKLRPAPEQILGPLHQEGAMPCLLLAFPGLEVWVGLHVSR